MRLLIISLFLSIGVTLANHTYAQSTEISVQFKNEAIAGILEAVEQQTDFTFIYDSKAVDTKRKVSVYADRKNIFDVLNQMFVGSDIAYTVVNKKIILIKEEDVIALQQKQQGIAITGTIIDNTGEAMPGVNIQLKGTIAGAVSDINGKYTINVPNNEATLVFSFVGYKPQEFTVGDQRQINVMLEEDAQEIEEVVVVGYGVQKKVNLTGSVSTVSADKIANRPAMNLSTTLAGTASGVNITQGTGNPGSENVSIRIRGAGSFNNSAPLVLVDGVVADMNVLNSDDVESVSILKDASSAAIYGSRAANGVILVTTKKGKVNETPKVNFSAMFAREKPITGLKFTSSTADFMELHNIAKLNANPSSSTTPDYAYSAIDDWRAADADPNGTYTSPITGQTIPNWLAYPNTDWAQVLFKPTYYQRYGLSVTGGSKNTSYMLSLGYQKNPGTLENTSMQRFNIRANLETKIADFITFGTQTYAVKEMKDPGNVSLTYLFQAFPGITPKYDGKYGGSEDTNLSGSGSLLRDVAVVGGKNTNLRINTSWYTIVQLPVDGLAAEAKFNYSELNLANENYDRNLPTYSFRESFDVPRNTSGSLDQAATSRYSYQSSSYTATALLRYNRTFGKHDVGALAGYEQYRTEYSGFRLNAKGLPDWSVTDINAAAVVDNFGTDKQKKDNSKSEYAMLSYFGRVNYVYANKYLFEANIRSDASSRFAPGHRTGVFPSVSAGWRISEESFFEPVMPYVNYLKLRASYGSLGNMVSGYYDWQALYKKVNNVLGEDVSNGIVQSQIKSLALSWEKLTTYSVALEAGFLKQRLTAELEFYSRLTSDILAPTIIPQTMGSIDAPMTNTASMTNKGIELTLGWNDRIGNFRYSVNANMNYNVNEVTKFKGALDYAADPTTPDTWGDPTWRYTNLAKVSTADGNKRRVEGQKLDEFYLRRPYQGSGAYTKSDGTVDPNGGPKDGMIRTKADLEWVKSMIAAGYSFDNKMVGSSSANIWYGQILMTDVNGDGKYGNDDDREFTGKSSTPKFTFGLNLNAEWKGIDMSMLWSGRLGSHHYVFERGANASTLGNVADVVAADAWNMYYFYDAVKADSDYDNYDPATDPNANINGKFPRLLSTSTSIMQPSIFYLYNTSYLKLKSLQVGYTLPKRWLAPLKISNLRIYMSGENLLIFKNKDFPGVDPELGDQLTVYPTARLISGGISVTF